MALPRAPEFPQAASIPTTEPTPAPFDETVAGPTPPPDDVNVAREEDITLGDPASVLLSPDGAGLSAATISAIALGAGCLCIFGAFSTRRLLCQPEDNLDLDEDE
jgi:hypothetical protein